MTDIVERLRRVAKELPQTSGNQAWLKPEDTTAWEAADEIEKLRAENAKLAASNHAYLSDYQEAADEIEKLRAENERLTNNARSETRLLAAYHKWCDIHGCAPSSSDLSKARAALEGGKL